MRFSRARRAIAAPATSRARPSTRRRRRRTTFRRTNNCAACHNTISFRPDVHFDHAEVLGSCVSCHNGTIAQGEGPTHPATSQNCAACHTVMSWNPPRRSITPRSRWRSPATASSATTACRPPASPRPHRHQSRVRRLPSDHHLAGRELRSHRDHQRLLELSQRHQGGGQAGQSHAHDQPVRELPYHRHRHQDAELGALELRSHADDGDDLPDLPQRHGQDHHGLRLRAADQSRAADSLGHRLRRLPRQ